GQRIEHALAEVVVRTKAVGLEVEVGNVVRDMVVEAVDREIDTLRVVSGRDSGDLIRQAVLPEQRVVLAKLEGARSCDVEHERIRLIELSLIRRDVERLPENGLVDLIDASQLMPRATRVEIGGETVARVVGRILLHCTPGRREPEPLEA